MPISIVKYLALEKKEIKYNRALWDAAGISPPGTPIPLQLTSPAATPFSGSPGIKTIKSSARASPGLPRSQLLAVGLTNKDFHGVEITRPRFRAFCNNIGIDPKEAVGLTKFVAGEGKNLADIIKITQPELMPALQMPLTGLAVFAASADVWKAVSEKDTKGIVIKGAVLGANLADLLSTAGLVDGGTGIKLVCILLKSVDSAYTYGMRKSSTA
jgi:hypothetical protein